MPGATVMSMFRQIVKGRLPTRGRQEIDQLCAGIAETSQKSKLGLKSLRADFCLPILSSVTQRLAVLFAISALRTTIEIHAMVNWRTCVLVVVVGLRIFD